MGVIKITVLFFPPSHDLLIIIKKEVTLLSEPCVTSFLARAMFLEQYPWIKHHREESSSIRGCSVQVGSIFSLSTVPVRRETKQDNITSYQHTKAKHLVKQGLQLEHMAVVL